WKQPMAGPSRDFTTSSFSIRIPHSRFFSASTSPTQASSPRHARNLRDPAGGPRSHRRGAHIRPLLANVSLGALFPPLPLPSYPSYAVLTGVPMSNSWMSRPLNSVDPEIAQAIANEE